jgi:multiple sugar transport system substrate-binding protein
VNAKAKKPDIPGIDGFLPTKYDILYPATPTTATHSKLEGLKYQDAFTKYILVGGELDKVIADLNTRYNSALDKARASGDTKVQAIPDFDAAKL